MKATVKEQPKAPAGFTKEAILKSRRFANRRDALSFLLREDETYTPEQVETILNDYMKKEVN